MSARAIFRCDEDNCPAYFDTPIFDDDGPGNGVDVHVPGHWDITLPGLRNRSAVFCPTHARKAVGT